MCVQTAKMPGNQGGVQEGAERNQLVVLSPCHVVHGFERGSVLVEQARVRGPAILRAARVDVAARRHGPLHDALRRPIQIKWGLLFLRFYLFVNRGYETCFTP